ncbi:hypothetical protein [Tsuneonella sp. HG222]
MAETKKKKTLKQKVDAAQARQAERQSPTLMDRAGETAIEAKDQLTAFAKKHPIATVAGGIAVGILVAGMFRGPRKAAVEGGTKLAGLAAVGAELALAYAAKAFDAAKEAGDESLDWLEDLGLRERARTLGSDVADYAGSARDTVVESGRSAARAVRGRLN